MGKKEEEKTKAKENNKTKNKEKNKKKYIDTIILAAIKNVFKIDTIKNIFKNDKIVYLTNILTYVALGVVIYFVSNNMIQEIQLPQGIIHINKHINMFLALMSLIIPILGILMYFGKQGKNRKREHTSYNEIRKDIIYIIRKIFGLSMIFSAVVLIAIICISYMMYNRIIMPLEYILGIIAVMRIYNNDNSICI